VTLPIRPTHDHLFIDIIDRDVTKKDLGGGKVLHLLADDTFGLDRPHDPALAKHPGIRPRWARVLEVGPDVEGDVKPGDLVLCDTLKWSHRIPLGRVGLEIVYFWRININDILLVNESESDEQNLPDYSTVEFTIGHL
jgi:hypothetical protein